jgi:peptidyl-prolyl cis-trans isomerase D
MMKQMRENMPLIMWIIVISFLITIVVSWGAGGFQGSGPKPGVIADIGGREILYEVFAKGVQNVIANRRSQDENIDLTEDEITKIRQDVWGEIVRNELMAYTAKKLGLKTADREVAWAVRNSPPETVVRMEYFQTDGQFDRSKWNAYLDDPQSTSTLVEFEKDYRRSLGNQKVVERVLAPVFVTEEEIRREFMNQYIRFSAIIAGYLASGIEVDTNAFSDEDIEEYFFSHKDRYTRPEMRAVRSVTVSSMPTEMDSAQIVEQAEEVLERLRGGENFAELAQEYSDDAGSGSKGGDLGYFTRDRMVPEFGEAAFETPVGELSGLVRTRYGIHIIKVVDRKTKGEVDSVRASHILFSWKASPETEERAAETAREFQELAKKVGFEEAAQRLDLEVVDSDLFARRSGQIPGIGRIRAAIDFIFSEAVGKISYPYKTRQGYTVLQCREMKPEGLPSIEDARYAIVQELVKDRKLQIAADSAEAFRQRVGSADNLVTVAVSEGVPVDTAETVLSTGFFALMGVNEYVGRELRSMEVGQLSPVLRTDRGAFLALLTEKTPFDSALYQSKKAEISDRLTNTQRNTTYSDWFSRIKEESGFRDNRYLYFSEY